MITLENVSKIYQTTSGQVTALQDINLQVLPGEIYGVIGRSGAGKSTLIRCVNLLERPTAGRIVVDDRDLMQLDAQHLRDVRHMIGMVFQHFNLLSSRTVYQNIALPLELLQMSTSDIERAVMPLLELTGLKERMHAYPYQLSGGQKQRVAIARALATKPKVLLCDEMTSALDPETTHSILQLVKKINHEMNLTMLLITHEMEVIKSIADHVAVIDAGKIIEQSDVVSLFRNPQTDVAKRFTQSILKGDLPHYLLEKLRDDYSEGAQLIVRIAFIGESATQPIIDSLVKHSKVSVNILQANLELLHHETIGMMFVGLSGKQEDMQQALTYLQKQSIDTEVLGYVFTDDLAVN